jgi:ubiquinone/menaquinone biosynthesis C-methylase UbiE
MKIIMQIIRGPEYVAKKLVEFFIKPFAGIESFGFTEAIAYSWRIDVWHRYSLIAKELHDIPGEKVKILDIGAGGYGVSEFIENDRFEIYVLDINPKAFGDMNSELVPIIGDGSRLPFLDKTFAAAISVDSLEHVPDSIKKNYISELFRVARKKVIMHFPAVDGEYDGLNYDIKFNDTYKYYFGNDEPNTYEHIKAGLPRITDLKEFFSDSEIKGTQNCNVWYKYMILERLPYVNLVSGLYYKLFLERDNQKPPFHSCMIVKNMK